ncbi:hypothetical protein [Thiorhodovibrio frisius]|uniref:Uncharacterized protein n=1 Tax=Thiorhodovibrio frisius TaxID=631362 RepID=H8Z7Y2_9GAMM|nr:hypothetical protein [Thiorhodovibrio frisius]EIC20994.1 hypothetical protein Thi970DRAFT_04676 [Thiorhodovibrio frisius]WPL22050.1 hypothetical protein Thiofri_02201 [Thiorhodovibrio frisius]
MFRISAQNRPFMLALAASLLVLQPTAFATEAPPAPTRISLSCVEQPTRQVSFDGQGQVSYTEVAAENQEPITLTIIKTSPGEAYNIEPARIESSAAWLNRAEAVWSRETQVDADNGRLRIDLSNNQLYITEAEADGNAHFRRFHCEPVVADEATGTTAQ